MRLPSPAFTAQVTSAFLLLALLLGTYQSSGAGAWEDPDLSPIQAPHAGSYGLLSLGRPSAHGYRRPWPQAHNKKPRLLFPMVFAWPKGREKKAAGALSRLSSFWTRHTTTVPQPADTTVRTERHVYANSYESPYFSYPGTGGALRRPNGMMRLRWG